MTPGRRWRCGVRPAMLAAWLALALPGTALAQVVRGTVTERSSGAPVAGVVVTLQHAGAPGADDVASALSDETGAFAIRAPGAGRYVLGAKRIGVRRVTLPPFTLAEGETREVNVQVEGLLFTLPEVEVVATGTPVCAVRGRDARRVAALWDEARTALTATRLSVRDRPIEGTVVRHVLSVDPENTAALRETHARVQNAVEHPFTSLDADSLSALGYWREISGDSAIFFGPDAEVLLSEAFRRDHCYSVAEGNRTRRGLIGLGFEPVADRTLPDVRGTLWMDARTFELRFLEFHYSRLPLGDNSERVGGEVHFARLPNGAWFVRRWFIRMPQFRRPAEVPAFLRAAYDSLATVYRMNEEGGSMIIEGVGAPGPLAALEGTVLDSLGQPMRDATVRLAGTPYRTALDAQGRFRFDTLPAGGYSVAVEQRGYLALGVMAAHRYVHVDPGATERVALRAIRARPIAARLCDGKPSPNGRATLRVVMVDSATTVPFVNVPFRISWLEPRRGDPAMAWQVRQVDGTTDRQGAVNFCDLPAEVELDVAIARGGRMEEVPVSKFKLAPDEVSARVVFAKVRREGGGGSGELPR